MNHILSDLPESYKKIVENIEDNLYEKYNLITTNRVFENLSVKLLLNGHTNGNETLQRRTKIALQRDPVKGYLQNFW